VDEPRHPAIQFIDLYNYENFTRVFLPLIYREISRKRPVFKSMYRGGERESGKAVKVAVHFRAGDIGPDRNAFMWVAPEVVGNSIREITTVLSDMGVEYSTTIVAQEESEHIRRLDHRFTRELIGADTIESFTELASADVLVMAKSYFSYMAAYFSDAVCIFRPWGNILGPHFPVPIPLEEWISSDPAGGLDRAAFRDRLEALLRRKDISHA
jgi:hypothetical protein